MNPDKNLPFKGGRNYLHSTTVFDDIRTIRGQTGPVDFAFNHKTDRQVRYQSEPPHGDTTAVATWKDDAGILYVIEQETQMTERVPYDEDGLAATFVYEANPPAVSIPADIGPYSRFEAVVAGFKAMLQKYMVKEGTRLAFARIRLQQPLDGSLKIQYGRRIGHFHQGSIGDGTKNFGQVFFGEWQ